jgi:MinD-like ATPase involved in chromosome partitioning or flagellar assembly
VEISMRERVPALVAAGGAAWEAAALRALADAGVVVVKRCVDLQDLIASAMTGQADVAVVDGELVGLDGDAVQQLWRHEVRCVGVDGDAEALTRLGVVTVVPGSEPERLPDAVRRAVADDRDLAPADPFVDLVGDLTGQGSSEGRVVVVHGPAGAPGRTTLAIGLAAAHARCGHPTVLLDADPHGGAVAQHLGVLDEVCGLLAAARLANAGSLDAAAFARCRRVVADELQVVTGLPRPDRWVEVRPGVLDTVLDRAREVGDVVVDSGFSLEDDTDRGRARGMARNRLTLDALGVADEVVVVGSAEPTGLARLARTLVELREATAAPQRVVVNRMRDSLGWSRRDITGMVEGYVRPLGVHFLPEDRETTDRALVTGRSVVELGDSALRRGLEEVHDAVFAQLPISR